MLPVNIIKYEEKRKGEIISSNKPTNSSIYSPVKKNDLKADYHTKIETSIFLNKNLEENQLVATTEALHFTLHPLRVIKTLLGTLKILWGGQRSRQRQRKIGGKPERKGLGETIGLAKSRKGVLEARLSAVMGEGVFFQKLLLVFEYISFKISIFNLYQHSALRFARTFLNLTAHLSEPKN